MVAVLAASATGNRPGQSGIDPARAGTGTATETATETATVERSIDAPPGRTETTAFVDFYHQEYRAIVGFGYVLSGSWSTAEDLAQDAMLEAQRNWAKLAAFENPAGWARRVLLNKQRTKIRKFTSERKALSRLASRPTEHLVVQPETDQMFDLVRQLPRRQAQAIALRYWDGYSTQQIAQVLGCGPETVKTHLKRGRAALRQKLDADGTVTS